MLGCDLDRLFDNIKCGSNEVSTESNVNFTHVNWETNIMKVKLAVKTLSSSLAGAL